MCSPSVSMTYDGQHVIRITKWKVRVGSRVGQTGTLLFNYRECDANLDSIGDELRFKCSAGGIIIDSVRKRDGDLVIPGETVLTFVNCNHNTIMKDLCADCGANINSLDDAVRQRIAELTTVSMIHSVPELRVSKEHAESLGRADEQRLLRDRKLVLLVDLDQTIIHTTNHEVSDQSEVHHFQLYGAHTPWYHTKFRPHTLQFLRNISKKFELHICTFGARRYAHEIATLLDPKEVFFPKDRILSRDECFDATSKTGNMKSLFPCGDSLVCIIDDREDVWNFAPNLVTVKPYVYFRETGDINAPEKSSTNMFLSDINRMNELQRKNINDSKSDVNDNVEPVNDERGNDDQVLIESADSVLNVHMSDVNKEENENVKYEETENNEEMKEKTCVETEIEKIENKNEENANEKKYVNDNINEDMNNEKVEETEERNKEDIIEINETNITEVTEEKLQINETNSTEVIEEKVQINEINTDEIKECKLQINETDSIFRDGEEKLLEKTDVFTDDKSKNILGQIESDSSNYCSDDNDDYLLYLEEILTRIHSEYYTEYEEKLKYKTTDEQIKIPDLKEIIPRVRKCVLRGVNIVFSGVIPTNIPAEKNKLYNIAKNFGANITNDLVFEGSPKTTHLVAAKWGTIKVNKCVKARNIWIVNPLWLYCCAERWERVDERLYLLGKDDDFSEKERLFKPLSEHTMKNVFVNQPAVKKTIATNACPVYDPITGKRIRQTNETPDTFLEMRQTNSQNKNEEKEANKVLKQSLQIQPHNMVDFSPLSQFTRNELQSMGKEVDDACSEGDAMSTGNTDSDSDIDVEEITNDSKTMKRKRDANEDTSSEESANDDYPKGWSKKNKKPKPVFNLEDTNDSTEDSYDLEKMRAIDDDDSSDGSIGSIGSVDEEMAAAVEREFLS